ncbi:MAG: glycosyltransferase [Candidatus Falkowbacteria bacterium]|nr:glycosyltransferase [Candidatus Falkowbacteria bacterium]
MKICLLHNLFGPFARGGAEVVAENIAEGFLERGDEVVVITTKPWLVSTDKYSGKFRVYFLGSFYYYLNKTPIFFRWFWHLCDSFDFITAYRIKKILQQERADLVITNNLAGLSKLTPLFISHSKIKQVHILHDIQLLHPSGLILIGQENVINSWMAKIYQGFNKYYCQQVANVVSPSEWLLTLHQQRNFFPSAKKIILANPIKVNLLRSRQEKTTASFKVLFVGQLEEHKGILFLLVSWQEFRKSAGTNVFLEIIGDGGQLATVKKASLTDTNIIVSGKLSRGEVVKKMSRSDLLVLPSLAYENYPSVIIEAISQNLPVLAADLGGVPEIIKTYGGILFKPADQPSLLAELEKIIKNPPLLEEIRNQYEQIDFGRFSPSSYVKNLLSGISQTHF